MQFFFILTEEYAFTKIAASPPLSHSAKEKQLIQPISSLSFPLYASFPTILLKKTAFGIEKGRIVVILRSINISKTEQFHNRINLYAGIESLFPPASGD